MQWKAVFRRDESSAREDVNMLRAAIGAVVLEATDVILNWPAGGRELKENTPPKRKTRTPDERPGGESGGIFHFQQEAVPGLSAFLCPCTAARPSRSTKSDEQ